VTPRKRKHSRTPPKPAATTPEPSNGASAGGSRFSLNENGRMTRFVEFPTDEEYEAARARVEARARDLLASGPASSGSQPDGSFVIDDARPRPGPLTPQERAALQEERARIPGRAQPRRRRLPDWLIKGELPPYVETYEEALVAYGPDPRKRKP
jgi:hypothetical protein